MQHLVVGGTGFIGGHLVEHLVERGGQVRLLARRPERPAWLPRAAELAQGDLSDVADLAGHARDADLVYVTTPLPASHPDVQATTAGLNKTLRDLVAVCHRARVGRLVYLSGVDLYRDRFPSRPIDEDFPTEPVTPAGRLRLAAERTLREAAGARDLPLVILRPVTVFGPRDHAFTRPLLDAYACPPGPSLVGRGRARLSLVYVKDVARALAHAARHPNAPGQTFHVSGCATTWRALIATLCVELNVPTPRPGLPYRLAALLNWWAERTGRADAAAGRGCLPAALVGRTRLYSDARLVRALAYHPAYDLLAGVGETVAWYRGLARAMAPARPRPPTVVPLRVR